MQTQSIRVHDSDAVTYWILNKYFGPASRISAAPGNILPSNCLPADVTVFDFNPKSTCALDDIASGCRTNPSTGTSSVECVYQTVNSLVQLVDNDIVTSGTQFLEVKWFDDFPCTALNRVTYYILNVCTSTSNFDMSNSYQYSYNPEAVSLFSDNSGQGPSQLQTLYSSRFTSDSCDPATLMPANPNAHVFNLTAPQGECSGDRLWDSYIAVRLLISTGPSTYAPSFSAATISGIVIGVLVVLAMVVGALCIRMRGIPEKWKVLSKHGQQVPERPFDDSQHFNIGSSDQIGPAANSCTHILPEASDNTLENPEQATVGRASNLLSHRLLVEKHVAPLFEPAALETPLSSTCAIDMLDTERVEIADMELAENPAAWTTGDCARWLSQCSGSGKQSREQAKVLEIEFATIMKGTSDNEIDGNALLLIPDHELLQILGVTVLGRRIRLISKLTKLRAISARELMRQQSAMETGPRRNAHLTSALGHDDYQINLAIQHLKSKQGDTPSNGSYVWCTEFENVHSYWTFREPPVKMDQVTYKSVENYYHAQKPKPFDEETWNAMKGRVMKRGLEIKFSSENPELVELLKSTGRHPLLAIKPDLYWGFHNGSGENMLAGKYNFGHNLKGCFDWTTGSVFPPLPEPVTEDDLDEIQTIIDMAWERLCDWIESAAAATIGKLQISDQTPSQFWTAELEATRDDLCDQLTFVQNEVNAGHRSREELQALASELTQATQVYRAELTDRRRILFEDAVDNLSTPQNTAAFMRMVKGAKARKDRTGCKLDPELIEEHAQYFRTTFGAPPTGLVDLPRPAARAPIIPSQGVDEIVDEVLVDIVIHQLPLGKACGVDNLPADDTCNSSAMGCGLTMHSPSRERDHGSNGNSNDGSARDSGPLGGHAMRRERELAEEPACLAAPKKR
ncbi:hypothetical protein HDU83_003356 [Entophlyctis luteolus]|nr:hypothetical protein HDU83_003356 [Entophlyctis luteolus]